jgi:serine/threonine-protein kinase
MTSVSNKNEGVYQFEGFQLDAVKRVLTRDGRVVPLTAKRLELLLVLVRNSSRVVTKDELMSEVWPDTVVEESNLAHNISALRKALGERPDEHRFILTIPGQGYRFVAGVSEAAGGEDIVVERTRARLTIEEVETGGASSPALESHLKALPQIGRDTDRNKARKLVTVAAFCAMLVGVGFLVYELWPDKSRPVAELRTIAVLPFKPLVAEGRDESLEMGMADTLIARLSNVKEINVRPISSVRKYADLEQDAVAAGREQRVEAVVEGQIQRSGEKIRVTVRLVRVEDGAALWTAQFDEKLTDIFRVQDSISERVVGALAVKLSGEEKERIAKIYTDNTEAYQLYLMGRFLWAKRTKEAVGKSIAYFSQAIEKDPNFALAYAGLADSYTVSGFYFYLPAGEAYPKAGEAATKAINIDDALAEAHVVRAAIKRDYEWDWAGAETAYKRALELNPNLSTVHHRYGLYLGFIGRHDESVASLKRAQELDPLSIVINNALGGMLLFARRYDEAIAQYHKVLEMEPNYPYAHYELGEAYFRKNMTGEAVAEFLKGESLTRTGPQDIASIRKAYETSGVKGFWQAMIDAAKKRSGQDAYPAYDMACLYANLGDRDKAFEWLERAYRERSAGIAALKVDLPFDNLRDDPRFAELLRRVGLSQ